MKNLNTTSTFGEDVLPSASGTLSIGSSDVKFNEGNFNEVNIGKIALTDSGGYVSHGTGRGLIISGSNPYAFTYATFDSGTGIKFNTDLGRYDFNYGSNSLFYLDISGNVWNSGALEVGTSLTIDGLSGGYILYADGSRVVSESLLAYDGSNLTYGVHIVPSASGSFDIGTSTSGVNALYASNIVSYDMKVGADQASAGAAKGELWADSSAGYVVKLGI